MRRDEWLGTASAAKQHRICRDPNRPHYRGPAPQALRLLLLLWRQRCLPGTLATTLAAALAPARATLGAIFLTRQLFREAVCPYPWPKRPPQPPHESCTRATRPSNPAPCATAADNVDSLSPHKFAKLARDAGLADPKLSKAELDLLFVRASQASSAVERAGDGGGATAHYPGLQGLNPPGSWLCHALGASYWAPMEGCGAAMMCRSA